MFEEEPRFDWKARRGYIRKLLRWKAHRAISMCLATLFVIIFMLSLPALMCTNADNFRACYRDRLAWVLSRGQ